jgi:hypothetical protein
MSVWAKRTRRSSGSRGQRRSTIHFSSTFELTRISTVCVATGGSSRCRRDRLLLILRDPAQILGQAVVDLHVSSAQNWSAFGAKRFITCSRGSKASAKFSWIGNAWPKWRRKTGVPPVTANGPLACLLQKDSTGSPQDESVRLADWKPVCHDSRGRTFFRSDSVSHVKFD